MDGRNGRITREKRKRSMLMKSRKSMMKATEFTDLIECAGNSENVVYTSYKLVRSIMKELGSRSIHYKI